MGWNIQYTRHRDSVSDTHTHMGRESVAAAGVEKSDMVPETEKKTKVSRVCMNCVARQITLEIECKQWDAKSQTKDVHYTNT